MRKCACLRLLLAASFLLIFPGIASAETKMQVDIGWGGFVRSGRWQPVLVTVSDSQRRNVVLNIDWPQGTYSMHITQSFAVNPNPQTFSLLVPARGWEYQEATFTLADRDTDKTLARYPADGNHAFTNLRPFFDTDSTFIGMSGYPGELISLRSTGAAITSAFLEPRALPTAVLGFDALDVLILNSPNLAPANFGPSPLSDEQQQAIVDWVRTGGCLVLWPGDSGFPSRGPLVDILPARIGARANLDLSPDDRRMGGIPAHYKTLPAYALESRDGAEEISLLSDPRTAGYAGRAGLGRIVILPVVLSDLQITNARKAGAIWSAILQDRITVPPDQPENPSATAPMSAQFVALQEESARAGNAAMRIADFLGNVPGAGGIGFGYIAGILIALLLVVGPVDWFVLKKLGRQPWTWVTTSGWIALLTVSAIFAGYLFKSGTLHYNTLHTVDQVDDATIATTDYVALYSPRTAMYEIQTADQSWWQPADISGGSSGLKTDLNFHQSEAGNAPQPMQVNVWSLRMMRGDQIGVRPPVLAANLKVERRDGGTSIVGTVSNLTDAPLKKIRVFTQMGIGVCELYSPDAPIPAPAAATAPATGQARLLEIPPHGTVRVRATRLEVPATAEAIPYLPYSRFGGYAQQGPPSDEELPSLAADLNPHRGHQMSALMHTGKFVIVYAQGNDPSPSAKLAGTAEHEQHLQFIRALFALHSATEEP